MRRVCLQCGFLFDSTSIESPCRVCGWKFVKTKPMTDLKWVRTDERESET